VTLLLGLNQQEEYMAQDITKSFGEVGFEAYGDHPGQHGPWTTDDGRPMPQWPELAGSAAGPLTRERWEVAAQAIIAEHERRRLDTLPPAQVVGDTGIIDPEARMLLVGSHPVITNGMIQDVIAASPAWAAPFYDSRKRELVWPNGARALVITDTSDTGDILRGRSASLVWAVSLSDEQLRICASNARLRTFRMVSTKQTPQVLVGRRPD
jgi:hypothetical protein